MAYKISDECIACGACEAECPVSAISEGDGKYEINPDVCTGVRQLRRCLSRWRPPGGIMRNRLAGPADSRRAGCFIKRPQTEGCG